jgi:hypothetical protein
LQTLNAVNARLGLRPSPLYATLGAAWFDKPGTPNGNLYEVIPYVGVALSNYINRRQALKKALTSAGRDAAVKTRSQLTMRETGAALRKLDGSDFMDLFIGMLLVIHEFQSLVSHSGPTLQSQWHEAGS